MPRRVSLLGRRTAIATAFAIAATSLAAPHALALPQPPRKTFTGYGTSEAAAYDDALSKAAAASYGSCIYGTASDPHGPTYWTATVSCVQILQ